MKSPEHIASLFSKYLAGTFSEAELQEMLDHVEAFGEQSPLRPLIAEVLEREVDAADIDQGRIAELDVLVHQELENRRKLSRSGFRIHRLRWIGVAAAIAAVVFGTFLYLKLGNKKELEASVYQNDVAPGKMGATLTLANGKRILLSDAKNGELASESGVTITKTATGELVYQVQDQSESTESTNILTTAKGETYQVILPDGSKVWLNAASSLKYPAKFVSDKRMVSLDGEAYFEIAKDKAHPFIVHSAKQAVEVLGTHFNVNTYSDEPNVKTTLLEGVVKVTTGAEERVMKPGQETSVAGNVIAIKNVDAEDAIAWKNGLFFFEDEPLETIMKRVARWYNVEVVYEDGVDKNELYLGSVSRYDKISKVLSTMERTKSVHFKIEGRRILVMR